MQPESPEPEPQSSQPEQSIQQQVDHSNLGGGQQATIGNENIQIQGNNNWVGNIFKFFGSQELVPTGNAARSKNQRLLLDQVKSEVTARLKQSLHNAVLINLGKELQPQQVRRFWDAEIKIGLKPPEPIPENTSILDIFDSEEIVGKLLILGVPGSGKTTTLLELAQALIQRAEEQLYYPIPVLFNLSSWKDNNQPVRDWLVAELESKYKMRKDIAENWVNDRQLLPMLDGLDELESARQELCVRAINQLLQEKYCPQYVVVCSRSEEYDDYETKLRLNGAICLQLLTKNQICRYLADVNNTELRHFINNDPNLLELAKIPFVLSIFVLAYQEIFINSWENVTEERWKSMTTYKWTLLPSSTSFNLQYLLDIYVQRMLEREIDSKAYVKNQKPPTYKQTRLWLIWLAQQLQRESQTELLIERIQPNWLLDNFSKQNYALVVGFIFGLIGGLIVGLSVWLVIGLITSLILGIYISVGVALLFGFFFGIWAWLSIGHSKEVQPVETLNTSWVNLSKSLIVGLFIAVISWVITSIIFSLMHRQQPEIVIFLIAGSILVMVLEMKGSEIQTTTYPNQGIWQSFKNAVRFTLLGAIVMGSLAGLMREEISLIILGSSTAVAPLMQIVLSGMIMGLFFGLTQAGTACIQHLSLRLVLKAKGYAPWKYACFLDYCTERLFLQRVGGRYRFIHKLLEDHFAQMDFKQN